MSKSKPTRLDAADLRRAVQSLIAAHGASSAAAVAMRRARNAELCGASDAARTWLQIAVAVQTMARRAPAATGPATGRRLAA